MSESGSSPEEFASSGESLHLNIIHRILLSYYIISSQIHSSDDGKSADEDMTLSTKAYTDA
ncbi:MAG: hypothetical protein R6V27_09805 [Balneolaceae bacterium]